MTSNTTQPPVDTTQPTRSQILASAVVDSQVRVDAARAVPTPAAGTTPPSPFAQLKAATQQLIHDPFGTIIGAAWGVVKDLQTALFSITPEELANPLIRARIRTIGIDPDKVVPTATRNEVLLAGGRTLAMAAGTLGGAGVGGLIARAGIGPVTTGAIEALAFGTTYGTLTPLEEGQTRAGAVLTSAALAVPFGVAGGVTSLGLKRLVKARGIKPELDAPEVSVTPPDVKPEALAHNDPARPDLAGWMGTGPESITPEALASTRILGLPEGAPEVLGGTPQDLVFKESAAQRVASAELASLQVSQALGVPVEDALARAKVVAKLVEEQPPTPPEQVVAAAMGVGEPPAKPPLSFDHLYTEAIDRLHPLSVATKRLLQLRDETLGLVAKAPEEYVAGKRLPGLEDPEVLARIANGSIAKASFVVEHGPLDWKTLTPAVTEAGERIPGLREILAPVLAEGESALNSLRALLAFPQAAAMEAHLPGSSPLPMEAMRAVVNREVLTPGAVSQPLVTAYEQLHAYRRALWQYVLDADSKAGGINANALKTMLDAGVPLHRFLDVTGEAEPFLGRRPEPAPGRVPVTSAEELRYPAMDPLKALINDTYALIARADQAAVAEALVNLAEQVPEQTLVRPVQPPKPDLAFRRELRTLRDLGVPDLARLTDVQLEGLESLFQPRGAAAEGVFSVVRGGEKRWFQVDADLWRALSRDRETAGMLPALLTAPVRLQKVGMTTFNPSFAARNVWRDQLTAALFTQHGLTPAFDVVRGLFKLAGRDNKLFDQFVASGAGHAALVRSTGVERLLSQTMLRDVIEQQRPLAKSWRLAKHSFELLRRIPETLRNVSEALEQATRRAEFNKAMAASGDPRLAALAGRQVTVDFGQIGASASARALNQLIPFFNPALQDITKVYRTLSGREGTAAMQRAWAKGVAALTVPTILLYLKNRNDPNYHELSEFRKDMAWNIPLGNGKFAMIPRPYLLGLVFAALPERAARWLDQRDPAALDTLAQQLRISPRPETLPAEEPFSGLGKSLGSQLPPMLPTALLPLLEVIANYDFFYQTPIVPEKEQRLLPPAQYGPAQTELAKLLGQVLNQSPRNIEHIISGYTGSLGSQILTGTDAVLQLVKRQAPENIPVWTQLKNSFVAQEPTLSARSVERFYTRLDDIEQIRNTVLAYVKQGKVADAKLLVEEHHAELYNYPLFKLAAERMARLREAINTVRADTTRAQAEREQLILDLGRTLRTTAQLANRNYLATRQRLEQPTPPANVRPVPDQQYLIPDPQRIIDSVRAVPVP